MVKTSSIEPKDFGKRLALACEKSKDYPAYGGQRWIVRELAARHGIVITPQAVNKWFKEDGGATKEIVTALASLLDANERWLATGRVEGHLPNARLNTGLDDIGAVNFVAGLLQMQGMEVSFVETDGDAPSDIGASVGGAALRSVSRIQVRALKDDGRGKPRFVFDGSADDVVYVGVVPARGLSPARMVRVTPEILREQGVIVRGRFLLETVRKGNAFFADYALFGDDVFLPEITGLADLGLSETEH